jgi:amidohydrolase
LTKFKGRIEKKISEELPGFVNMAVEIHDNPELGGSEFKTSALLVHVLKSKGWNVEYPYIGLPTAFNAVRKNGNGPVVDFMAEYDALPDIGHACGHNLNGVMSLLAGVALADAIGYEIEGEIRVVGTPAEETDGAKVEMANRGVFDDADFAMMVHASTGVLHPIYRSLAIVPLVFSFKGLASHAASAPWDGANALNALLLFFHAIDMLRQHVKPDTSIHGIITKGGEAPNIVPDFAQAAFYFRSRSRNYLESVLEKAFNCARGAALATGTDVSWEQNETSFREILPNPEAEKQIMEILDEMGFLYVLDTHFGGSTDVGDVSWRCPTLHIPMPLTEKKVASHSREFADITGDKRIIGKCIADGARIMARMGLRVLTDPETRRKMKDDLEIAKKK